MSLFMIHGIMDQNYSKAWPHTDERRHNAYILNIVKECGDIYIEELDCVEWKFKMTIDAKKIISTLSMPLENIGMERIEKYEMRNSS